MNDFDWMKQALALAKRAERAGDVPVGAILVGESGQVIGEGYNQTLCLNDPTAHAEMIAIRQAAAQLGNVRLNDATLYVTLEPCAMCAGAIMHARIKRLVFACRDFKTGACGGVVNIINGPASNHAIILDEGVLADSASQLLSGFFAQRRS